MRVIAGTARSVRLDAPKGMDTRPTTDKIKETLFNILQFDVPGSVFVDFFSGSGAMGIEAISRGAVRAVFVEHGKEACECIRKNLERCHFTEKAVLMKTDALAGAARIGAYQSDDCDTVFFMDPPYDQGLEYPVLRKLSQDGCIRGCDMIIIEKSLNPDTMEELRETAAELGLEIYREKEYKTQKHVFLRKEEKH